MRLRHVSIAALSCLLVLSTPAVAQDGRTLPPAASNGDPTIAALQGQLIEARQENLRLRAELAGKGDLDAALRAARDKNERLVVIANDLIRAYDERYRRGRFLPFDRSRRRFENELQATGDGVYDNRWDASPRRPSSEKTDAPAPANNPARTGEQ